ncbi:MAG: Sec-independent protein translocase protein TatB [Halomonas sp.]|nr:Sec-independent protein translocase protein TatB [Halomonas sp.]
MFDVGFLELLVIGVVGLLVLGPERLPKAARTVGLWIGKTRRTVANMQREINAQLEAEELRQKLHEQEKKLNAGLDKARREVEGYAETPPEKSAPPGTVAGEVPAPGTHGTPPPSGTEAASPADHGSTAPPPDMPPTVSDDKDSTPR